MAVHLPVNPFTRCSCDLWSVPAAERRRARQTAQGGVAAGGAGGRRRVGRPSSRGEPPRSFTWARRWQWFSGESQARIVGQTRSENADALSNVAVMDVEQVKLERIRDRLDALISWITNDLTWPTRGGSFSLLMQASLVDAVRTGAAVAILAKDSSSRDPSQRRRSSRSGWPTAPKMSSRSCGGSPNTNSSPRCFGKSASARGRTTPSVPRSRYGSAPKPARWIAQYGKYGEKSWWANEVIEKSGKWKNDAGASRRPGTS